MLEFRDILAQKPSHHLGERKTPLQRKPLQRWKLNQVGATGFEPAISCSQSRRDTGLRYAPSKVPTYYAQPTSRNAGSKARNARPR
jgi:hypothetical protein